MRVGAAAAAIVAAGMGGAAADATPPTIGLGSFTAPPAGKICVVGYSVQNAVNGTIPGYYLTLSKTTPKQGTWVQAPSTATLAAPLNIRAYTVGTEITGLPVQPATGTYINSANLRFYYVSGTTSCSSIAVSIYFKTGAQSIAIPSFFHPSGLAEFTTAAPGTLTIDISNVDNFQLPISLTYTDGSKVTGLGNAVGHVTIENRQTMITGGSGISPFNAWLQVQPGYQALNGPKIFARLLPQSVGFQFAQLQSPTAYLGQKCLVRSGTNVPAPCAPVSQFVHLDDALGKYFKSELTTFFGSAMGLVVMGDGVPSITQQAWTVTSTSANCPSYVVADKASLEFTATGETPIIVCNPIGSVVPLTSGLPSKANFTQSQGTATLTLTAQQAAQYKSRLGWNLVQPESGFIAKIGTVTPTKTGATVPLTIVVVQSASAQQACTSGCPTPNFAFGDWYFSEIVNSTSTNPYEPLSQMVFANDGAFGSWLYPSSVESGDHTKVRLSIERNIVSAFSRGIANCNNLTMKVPDKVTNLCKTLAPLKAPAYTGTPGASDEYWANETNWYPANGVQNYYAQYLHTARLNPSGIIVPNPVACNSCFNIFRPSNLAATPTAQVTATSNQGVLMGMAYGFAYDENPPYVAAPAQVPSKRESLPFSILTGGLALDIGCADAVCASGH